MRCECLHLPREEILEESNDATILEKICAGRATFWVNGLAPDRRKISYPRTNQNNLRRAFRREGGQNILPRKQKPCECGNAPIMTSSIDAVNNRGLSYRGIETYILRTGRHAIHASEPVASICQNPRGGKGKEGERREGIGLGSQVRLKAIAFRLLRPTK